MNATSTPSPTCTACTIPECYRCPPGRYSYPGMAECLLCRVGEIALNESSVECTKCKVEETTDGEGSTKCICGAQTYRANDANGSCTACSGNSMDCSAPGTTVASLKIEAGYWRADNGTMSLLPCPVPKACNSSARNGSNSSCALGHHGALCAVCELGYTRFGANSLCKECPETLGASIAWSLFFALLAAFCLWFFLWVSRSSQGGFIRPIINAWQTMSVVLSTSNDWPEAVKWIQEYVLQTVNLDII